MILVDPAHTLICNAGGLLVKIRLKNVLKYNSVAITFKYVGTVTQQAIALINVNVR